MNPDKPPGESS